MQTLFELKESEATATPLLLFDCIFSDSTVYRWCTQAVIVGDKKYEPRISRNNFFESQMGSDQGVDTIPKLMIELANADSFISELERSVGFKGARLICSFYFSQDTSDGPNTGPLVLFQGICNSPESITESTARISAINRLSAQRVVLPSLRVQRRCAWNFPSTAEERAEAVDGGNKGERSPFYPCGYSADQATGVGNLAGGAPYTTCSFTRQDCVSRGMFSADSRGRKTARFSGIEFVPSAITVRSAGERGTHSSNLSVNEARYNDFVPLVYGTAWFNPSIVFARNDGNLTRLEVLLGVGEIDAVHKVLVSDNDIPVGRSGQNMTGTGWFNVVSYGSRLGDFNRDFTDGSGAPLGDPYGSMAFLSVVVPNRINDGKALPEIKVLINGLKLAKYDSNGLRIAKAFTNNPAWIILDVLLRNGWSDSEIDLASFANTAAYCDEPIPAQDLHGNALQLRRFQCNVVLKSRKSAGDVLRGIRNSSRLFLTFGDAGKLTLRTENSLARQQTTKALLSNSAETLDGGWPVYEFGDGSTAYTGIIRDSKGNSSLKLFSKSASDTPNRFTIEFQDGFNEYQQDSFSVVDADDVKQAGQEINTVPSILGLPNFNQAARTLQFLLTKSTAGNLQVEFQTSVKALGIIPGDIIAITYARENFSRQPFRVTKISPGENFRTVAITAQIHSDQWYSDSLIFASGSGRRLSAANLGVPRPISGIIANAQGGLDFGVSETSFVAPEGTATVLLSVEISVPPLTSIAAPSIPLIGLTPSYDVQVKGFDGGSILYYAISGLDASGNESGLSFIVRAALPDDRSLYSVTLKPISFSNDTTVFNVYRGTSPAQLNRIASSVTLAGEYKDSKVPLLPLLPPDSNFHHTTIYWRLESEAEVNATINSSLTVGSEELRMKANAYVDFSARIIEGKGLGQERLIISNSPTVVTVARTWDIIPDATSRFVISETPFRVGASGQGSRFQIEVPNRENTIVQIFGRSANAAGAECPPEISPMTRWKIGGAGLRSVDFSVADAPVFGLSLSQGQNGTIKLGGVGFSDLKNTASISAGTLALHYQDELSITPPGALASSISETDLEFKFDTGAALFIGAIVRIQRELILIGDANPDGSTNVQRGVLNTTSAAYDAGESVYPLKKNVTSVPFIRNFFGTPSSGDWSYTIPLPNTRICAAEFYVTNSQGNSESAIQTYTNTLDSGIRTLSGGQYSFQVSGPLAVDSSPAPDVIVESDHAIGEIYAFLGQPATGANVEIVVRVNSVELCRLSFVPGSTVSEGVQGSGLPALREGDRLAIDIVGVGATLPGSDLTMVVKI